MSQNDACIRGVARYNPRRMRRLFVPAIFLAACASTQAPRPLTCTFSYGGESTTTRIPPTDDPYSVQPVVLGERLAYKVVYVDAPEAERVLSIYTYALSDEGHRLLHQAKYSPPFPDGQPFFTGVHTVYEPRNASDVTYQCGWAR